MEKIINVAIIHFVATVISFISFGALRGGDIPAMQWIFRTVARVITIPGRQLGQVVVGNDSGMIWFFYIANSFLWAIVIVKVWTMIKKRRGGAPETPEVSDD